jgi:1-deoxy-D-xylulose-5-phosphate reductoisomerase
MSAALGVAILGSTGSIGRSTLAVMALHPERYRVAMLGAHRSWESMVEQAKLFKPDVVVLIDPQAAANAQRALRECGSATRVECGEQALCEAVSAGNVRMRRGCCQPWRRCVPANACCSRTRRRW